MVVMMNIRPYVPADLPAVQRVWKECGWVDTDEEAAHLEHVFSSGEGLVALLGDEAECAVTTHRGLFNYAGEDLDWCLVSSVTTSRVGRKQGFAQAATARALASAAEDGAEIATLGMFEQGFYDRLGFGTGPYEHQLRFDPANLLVDTPYRTPVRLGKGDYVEVHDSMLRRLRGHGGVALNATEMFRAELEWVPNGFGLGYRTDDRLSHFIFAKAKGESGPYSIYFIAYENTDQLMELLSLLKSLGDQVRAIEMAEPAELQFQDLFRHPNRQRILSRGSDFEAYNRAGAWWQARVLDLDACVSKRHWAGPPVRFNLVLDDPIEAILTGGWTGVGGEYVVEFAETSSAQPGSDPTLETLTASVNAFTRMWIGVRSASSLSLTDDLKAPAGLLRELDQGLCLPPPRPGMFV